MNRLIKLLSLSMLLLVGLMTSAHAQGNFVYTNNDSTPNSVTAFSVATNGVLSQVTGSPFATGGAGFGGGFFAANRATTCILAKRLYVSNGGSDDVTGFNINPTTGALTLVPGSPFATGGTGGGEGISLACTPDGKFVIAANALSSNISVFSVAANGALTPILGSPFACGFFPDGIKVSSDGRFLAVALPSEGAGSVQMFSISSSGALALVGTFADGGTGTATGVDINSTSELAFVAESNNTSTIVDVFGISSTGSLAPISGSPFEFASGVNSNVPLLSSNERFLFVSNQFTPPGNQGSITVLNVAANGSLSLVAGSPFANPGGFFPSGMATNSTGTLLYAGNSNDSVSVFSIAANGTLTPAPGSPFSTGASGFSVSLAAFPPKQNVLCLGMSGGNVLRINTSTGEYVLCRPFGITQTGTGFVSINGCNLTFTDPTPNRRVTAQINLCTRKGTASVQTRLGTFLINDPNIDDQSCDCPT